MKNSMLLKVAAGLCAANVLLALWASWTMSNARSRLAATEAAIREAEQAITTVRSAVAAETKTRETEADGMKAEVKAISQLLDRLLKPQGGK
jgi:hypothetical protein